MKFDGSVIGKKHVWMDVWHGTDGFVFVATTDIPFSDSWLYRVRAQLVKGDTIYHFWSYEDFSWEEVERIVSAKHEGREKRILINGQWIE